jgi:hypothetical protein
MLLFAALFACSVPTDQRELDEARERWNQNEPTHYRYVHDEWAFSDSVGPVRIEVLDGEVVSAVIVETGEPAPADRELTIEDLFDMVQDEIDGDPDDITVDYDDELGFPENVDVDPIENAIDDEHGFSAEEFETLE